MHSTYLWHVKIKGVAILLLGLVILLEQSSVEKELIKALHSFYTRVANENVNSMVEKMESALQSSNCASAFERLNQPKTISEGIYTALYVGGKLKKWTHPSVGFAPYSSLMPRFSVGIIEYKNAWLIARYCESHDTIVVATLEVQKQFPVNAAFQGSEPNPAISAKTLLLNEKGLLEVDTEKIPPFLPIVKVILLLGFLGSLYLLLLTYIQANRFSYLIPLLLLLFRALALYVPFPSGLGALEVFSPSVFAYEWWLPSLADWIIYQALLQLFLFNLEKSRATNTFNKHLPIFIGLTFPALWVWMVENAIIHGSLSNDVADIFSLNVYSFLMFGFLACNGYLIFTATHKSIQAIFSEQTFKFWGWLLPLVPFVLFMITNSTVQLVALLIWYLLASFVYWLLAKKTENVLIVSATKSICLSLMMAFQINQYHHIKETAELQAIAAKMLSGRDYVKEYLMAKENNDFSNNREIRNLLISLPRSTKEVHSELMERLQSVWNNHTIRYYLYADNQELVLKSANADSIRAESFEQLIKNAEPINNKGLYFAAGISPYAYVYFNEFLTGRAENRVRYLLFATIENRDGENGTGYPEILLDKGVSFESNLSKYDVEFVAKEVHGLHKSSTLFWNKSWFFENSIDFRAISIRRSGNAFFACSNLFLIVFISIWLYEFIKRFGGQEMDAITLYFNSFRIRLILLLVIVSVVCLSAAGVATGYITKDYFDEQNRENAYRQASVVRHLISASTNTLSDQSLRDLSSELNVDANIYSSTGVLLFTSNRMVFTDGFVPECLSKEELIAAEQSPQQPVLSGTNLGNLDCYTLLTTLNVQGKQFILQVPFFAEASLLKNRLSILAGSFVNVFFLLLIFTTLVSAVSTGRIIKPLNELAERLIKMDIKRPEQIPNKRVDEIGNLIEAYNRMSNAVAESAKKLADAERDAAWREMAKQVAHEIKNPLTPMKLQIQHLQHLYLTNAEGKEEKLVATLKMLNDQIDSLADIATSFSSFARFPDNSPQRTLLLPVLESVKRLYSDNHSLNIIVEDQIMGELYVFIDRDQLFRAINNLVKNAMQSVSDDQAAEVILTVKRPHLNKVCIEVKDNGTGISEELKSKIFLPNFTTKSSGMGLGLAIVKRIVENAGGSIRFSDNFPKGTVFSVELPIIS